MLWLALGAAGREQMKELKNQLAKERAKQQPKGSGATPSPLPSPLPTRRLDGTPPLPLSFSGPFVLKCSLFFLSFFLFL
jgi:hypothetical protein